MRLPCQRQPHVRGNLGALQGHALARAQVDVEDFERWPPRNFNRCMLGPKGYQLAAEGDLLVDGGP
eukprot:7915663-Pyramimonas_sp.AAC.1